MKKLMFAVAAMAAGVAMADSITSANIVGYGKTGVREGSKMIGASFNKVSGTGMALQDLKPTGYEEVSYFLDCGVMGEFEIKILNNGGGQALDKDGNEADYFFNRSYDSDSGEWLDDSLWTYLNGDEPDNIVFEMGEGLWVYVSPDAYPDGVEQYYMEFPGLDDLAE